MLCEMKQHIPAPTPIHELPAERCMVEGGLGAIFCDLCPDCQEDFRLRGYSVVVMPKEVN